MGYANDSDLSETAHVVVAISDEVTHILKLIILAGVCQVVNIFGIVTNIINIICFVKQGFHDPVNISLLGLSVSDLGCLTTLLCQNLFLLAPLIFPRGLSFEPLDTNYLIFFMPHLAFSRVTSWITAVITLERCLCIVAPLKVKSILTRQRMIIIIVCIFLVLFLSGSPVYAVNRLGLKFSSARNETIVCLLYMNGRETVDTIMFAVNNFFIPLTAFIIIVICTALLVFKLHKIAQWRKSASNATTNVNNRNQKVAKMVVIISVLFISCFIPLSVFMLAVAFEPELSLNGRYLNIGLLLVGLGFVSESINSSVNIFIYHSMSSKYRVTFRVLFCKDKNVLHLADLDVA